MYNPRQNSAPQSILEMLSQMIPNYGALNNRTPNNGLWNGTGKWNGNGLWGGKSSAGGMSRAPTASPSMLPDKVSLLPTSPQPTGFQDDVAFGNPALGVGSGNLDNPDFAAALANYIP